MADALVAAARLELTELLFPVLAMKEPSGPQSARPMIFGTAFCLGRGIFVTAAHVLSEIAGIQAHAAIGVIAGDQLFPVRTLKTELIQTHDVGLMVAEANAVAALDWALEPVDILRNVYSIGYPYSIDLDPELDAWKASMRGFQGAIATRRKLWRLPGRPLGYEVDCLFPPGLSGAPLFDGERSRRLGIPTLRLVGMVLGEQTVSFGGRDIRVGEALDIIALAEVRSLLVGYFLREKTGKVSEDGKATIGELRDFMLAQPTT